MTLVLNRDGQVEGEPDPLIGTHAYGSFVITKKLGEGGMGAVYLAEDPDIGKVAIKVLLPALSQHGEALARFVGEAKAASRIGNPHIVKFQAKGVLPDGRVYLAMDYLDGSTLFDHLRSWGVLALEHALALLVQAGWALDAAHKRNIVHRDVKPENMFVSERVGQPLFLTVIDFGLAKVKDPRFVGPLKTGSNMVLGTPGFMAPEQYKSSSSVDLRADLYALGIIAYMMVTGVPPQLIPGTATWRSPKDFRPDLPEGWANAILWAMQDHPSARPRTVRIWINTLIAVTENGEQIAREYAQGFEKEADPDEDTRKNKETERPAIPSARTPAPGYPTPVTVRRAKPRRGLRAVYLVAGTTLLASSIGVGIAVSSWSGDEREGPPGEEPPVAMPVDAAAVANPVAAPLDAMVQTSTPVDAALAPAPVDASPADAVQKERPTPKPRTRKPKKQGDPERSLPGGDEIVE